MHLGRQTIVRAATMAASRRAASACASGASSRASSAASDVLGLVACSVSAAAVAAYSNMAEAGEALHPTQYPWSFNGWTKTFDHAAIRRGHQVFMQVCSSCHSVERLAFRNLVGVAYTEAEAKALAAEVQIEDGPNDKGEYFTRPGKLADYFPKPYANEQKARLANGGALPPDLSLIVKARHGGADYIFALITTGYQEPPAGIEIREGLHYNAYFPGGAIGMAKALYDGAVNYEDGTPATETQMARDVTTFLAWVAEPEADDRKRMGIKAIVTLGLLAGAAYYWKRLKWSVLKSRVIMRK